MKRCKDCDSDLIPEEAAECGGWCMGCAPSCADCAATPAIHPITRRGKPFHVCAPCNRALKSESEAAGAGKEVA